MERGPIEFRVDGWRLTSEQRDIARGELFPEQPANIDLDDLFVGEEPPCVLMISDRHTTGLGGPLRADQVLDPSVPRDFVDFLRNVGQPPDKRFGGGTFGYGKSVLYNASQVQTIAVYTRCRVESGHQSRFMCAALGGQFHAEFDGEQRPFTGRHWWGRMVDGVIDPLIDADADHLAGRLGFDVMAGDRTGTSILIFGPLFEERAPADAIAYLSDALLWSFWPKMIETPARPQGMRCGASWQGDELRIPSPDEHSRLRGFAAALREADKPDGKRLAITIDRPKRHLGWMAFHRFAVTGDEPDRPDADAAPLGPGVHHVALMRTPRNIVKYIAGQPLPHQAAGYAAVFVADDERDDAFAASEPPSHDDWLPEVLERGHNKRFVNVALRNIRQELQNHVAPPRPAGSEHRMPPLGAISHRLASLIPWEEGPGASLPVIPGVNAIGHPAPGVAGATGSASGFPEGPGSRGLSSSGSTGARAGAGGVGRRARVEILDAPRLSYEDGRPAVRLSFSVSAASGEGETLVRLQAGVAVQDGDTIETEPPEGGDGPVVLRWENADGEVIGDANELCVENDSRGPFAVVVATHAHLAVGLSLTAHAVTS
ncbi:MAG: hypothetical protein ACXVUE_12680 [Solirubrobacteraceae bacterium]